MLELTTFNNQNHLWVLQGLTENSKYLLGRMTIMVVHIVSDGQQQSKPEES